MRLNIRHAFIVAMGTSKKCTEIINKIYKEDEKTYYELYIKSKMYDDLLKKTLPMEDEEAVNKLIGIVEKCYKDNSFLKIEQIIKGLNPSILRYFKTANIIDISKFRTQYLEKNITTIEEPELFANLVSLMYLGKIYYKKIAIDEASMYFVSGTWDNSLSIMVKYTTRKELDEEDADNIKDYYKLLGLEPFQEIKEQSINLFMDNLIEERVLSKFTKEEIENKTINVDVYKEARNRTFNEGFYKYIGCFSRFISTLGLNSNLFFSDVNIDNDVLNVIFKDLYSSQAFNSVEDENAELYTVACMFLYNFVELYKKSKEVYLDRSSEEKYRELIEHEKELNQKEDRINNIIAKNEKKLKEKDDEIKRLKAEIKALKEERKVIKEDNRNLQVENEELNGELKNINAIETEKQMDQIEKESIITVEGAIENIKDKKIAIFGGLNNIREIRKSLPNVQIYNEINKDISSIKNADLIIINSDFFSHSFTKKINSVLNKYNQKYYYICGTNIDKIILSLNKYINS